MKQSQEEWAKRNDEFFRSLSGQKELRSMSGVFKPVFNASEWELQQDGAWVRNRYTNEYILLERFEDEAIAGILLVDEHIEDHPIVIDRSDSLTEYLMAVRAG